MRLYQSPSSIDELRTRADQHVTRTDQRDVGLHLFATMLDGCKELRIEADHAGEDLRVAAVVTASIREVIATLDEQITRVEREIRQHFDDHPDLRRKRDLLTSFPESTKQPPRPFSRRFRISIASSRLRR